MPITSPPLRAARRRRPGGRSGRGAPGRIAAGLLAALALLAAAGPAAGPGVAAAVASPSPDDAPTLASDATRAAGLDDGEEPLRIYIDADRTQAPAAGDAIEWGVRTALALQDGLVGGRAIEVVALDHRANARRSCRHLERIAEDPRALAVVGGMHSPVLLQNLRFIREHGLLHLVPWAAAGPITRGGDPNFVFRLSIDDARAGRFLVDAALLDHSIERPLLLLESTGWGDSNHATLAPALTERTGVAPEVLRFPWSLSAETAAEIAADIVRRETDAVFLVANAPEAAELLQAIAHRAAVAGVRPPSVWSHWGLTGRHFAAEVPPDVRDALELRVLQTRAVAFDDETSPLARTAWRAARDGILPPSVEHPSDLTARTGFVHAFDLVRLLDAAAFRVDLDAPIGEVRDALRRALETLDAPVTGLLGTYERPFDATGDAPHEALDEDDYVLARFTRDGRLVADAPAAAASASDED